MLALALQTLASSTTEEEVEEDGSKARLGKDCKEGGTEGGREREKEEGRVGSHLGGRPCPCRSRLAQDVLSRCALMSTTTGKGREKAAASG